MPACSPSALLQILHLVAVLLRPARVHALQHLGPVLRVGAAGAGVDLDVAVVGVGLAGQQALDLAPLRLLGQGAQRGQPLGHHRLVALGLGHADQLDRVGDLGFQLAHRLDARGELVPLAHQLLRRRGVVPEVRVLGAVVQFVQPGDARHPSQRCLLSSATDCLICSFRASDSADMTKGPAGSDRAIGAASIQPAHGRCRSRR